jgi:transposase
VTPKDNRAFVEVMLYPFRAGAQWRDLLARIGHRRNIHGRFGRWSRSDVFERIFKYLAYDSDNENAMIDNIIVRPHQHSARAQIKRV